MQDGLSTLLKHVGSLMRLFKLHDAQNCSITELETSVLKSPKTTKLSYFEEKKYQFPYHDGVNDQLLDLF